MPPSLHHFFWSPDSIPRLMILDIKKWEMGTTHYSRHVSSACVIKWGKMNRIFETFSKNFWQGKKKAARFPEQSTMDALFDDQRVFHRPKSVPPTKECSTDQRVFHRPKSIPPTKEYSTDQRVFHPPKSIPPTKECSFLKRNHLISAFWFCRCECQWKSNWFLSVPNVCIVVWNINDTALHSSKLFQQQKHMKKIENYKRLFSMGPWRMNRGKINVYIHTIDIFLCLESSYKSMRHKRPQ